METSTFFMLYPAVFIAGALITQVIGNADRPMHEGFLAWIFLPIGIIACLSALSSEGMQGLKTYWREFLQTLFNHRFHQVKVFLSFLHQYILPMQ